MSLSGQRYQPERYSLIPRTLTFLLHEDDILLMRVPKGRGTWSGLYNGVGGHIERGEEPYTAALREILEETNHSPSALMLCGIVQIDTKTNPGIGLYVFIGRVDHKIALPRGPEGTPEWVKISELDTIPLVEDLPQIIPKTFEAEKSGSTFFAKYQYDSEDLLTITFAPK